MTNPSIAARCAATDCDARFEGTGYYIRERMWTHHDTHAVGDFVEHTETGELVLFRFDPIDLSPIVAVNGGVR